MSRDYGYIRVSSKEQNSGRQKQALLEQGIDEDLIFEDKMSGKNFDRPDYQLLKRVIRKGDTLYIKELDRLGRNAKLIKQEWQELSDMGVNIVVMDMPILSTKDKDDTQQLISNIVLELLSYMAEQERKKIRKRQAEGIKRAKANGKHLGRPPMEMPDNFGEYHKKVYRDNEMTAVEAYKELDISKTKFYQFKKKYEKENELSWD